MTDQVPFEAGDPIIRLAAEGRKRPLRWPMPAPTDKGLMHLRPGPGSLPQNRR